MSGFYLPKLIRHSFSIMVGMSLCNLASANQNLCQLSLGQATKPAQNKIDPVILNQIQDFHQQAAAETNPIIRNVLLKNRDQLIQRLKEIDPNFKLELKASKSTPQDSMIATEGQGRIHPRVLNSVQVAADGIERIEVNESGTHLVIATKAQTTQIFSLTTGQSVQVEGQLKHLENDRLVVEKDRTVFIYNVQNAQLINSIKGQIPNIEQVNSQFTAIIQNQKIILLDLQSGLEVQRIEDHYFESSNRISIFKNQLLVIDREFIFVYDLSSKKRILNLYGTPEPSEDGKWLAVYNHDKTSFYELASGRMAVELNTSTSRVRFAGDTAVLTKGIDIRATSSLLNLKTGNFLFTNEPLVEAKPIANTTNILMTSYDANFTATVFIVDGSTGQKKALPAESFLKEVSRDHRLATFVQLTDPTKKTNSGIIQIIDLISLKTLLEVPVSDLNKTRVTYPPIKNIVAIETEFNHNFLYDLVTQKQLIDAGPIHHLWNLKEIPQANAFTLMMSDSTFGIFNLPKLPPENF